MQQLLNKKQETHLGPLFGEEERCTEGVFVAKSKTERSQVVAVSCQHTTNVLHTNIHLFTYYVNRTLGTAYVVL